MSRTQLWRCCLILKVFQGRISWGGGQALRYLSLCADFLRIGWWWGNREGLQESRAQPEVTVLHLVGALAPAEELKDILEYISWGGTRTLPKAALFFFFLFDYSSFLSAFPDKKLFESALWSSGKVKEAWWSLFPTNKKWGQRRGGEKAFFPGRVPQGRTLFQGW